MKCPNCGAEMKDGLLYCESCGGEIHIVPDFEPELENNLAQSMDGVLRSVAHDIESIDDRKKQEEQEKFNRKCFLFGCSVLIVFFVVAAVFCGIYLVHFYSADYQKEHARLYSGREAYEKAIPFYTRAIELNRKDIALRLELAEVYYLQNEFDAYVDCLKDVVIDSYADPEQIESAYGKLIGFYRAREDYRTINDLLLTCSNESILESYENYLARAPVFDIEPGEYFEGKILKINSPGKGTIYYTTDGKAPDEQATVYRYPILLENGTYHIQAVLVNAYGIRSEVVSGEYTISGSSVEIPEISPDSGEYSEPVCITVEGDASEVYYTTDGSAPTAWSTPYTGPIPIPMGVSSFRFVRIHDGFSSKVVDMYYVLEMENALSPEQAVDRIRDQALEEGRIIDSSGHIEGTDNYYIYQYLYVYRLTDGNDVYVISEIYEDVENQTRETRRYYGVNVDSGEWFPLVLNGNLSFEIQSETP